MSSGSPKRRSDSPRGRADSPKAKRSEKPKQTEIVKQRNEAALAKFIDYPRQQDAEEIQKILQDLDGEQRLRLVDQLTLVDQLLAWMREAQNLSNLTQTKTEFNDLEQEWAEKFLYEAPGKNPIVWREDVANNLALILRDPRKAKRRALKLIAQVEQSLYENPNPTRDEKRALVGLLEQASRLAPDVNITTLLNEIQLEPERLVLDYMSQPFYEKSQKLLEKLRQKSSLLPTERKIFIDKAKQIESQVEDYINDYPIEGLQLDELNLFVQKLYDAIEAKPTVEYRRPGAFVPNPLLSLDQLDVDKVKKLLENYAKNWDNAKDLERENIINNLRVISNFVRQQNDPYLKSSLETVLKKIGQQFSDPQNFDQLAAVIDSLVWPDRENFEDEDYVEKVKVNFQQILAQVPFFKQANERLLANSSNPQTSSCVASKQLDLHQLFAVAWFYCSSSTGQLDFFSTGAGKTATAWATLRMYRDQTKGRYGKKDNAKLIWVTAENLIEDAWKDSWAYSDVMIGYEAGKATPAQIAEKREIEKEVWFVNYVEFSNFITGEYKTYAKEMNNRYDTGMALNSKLLPEYLAGAKIIVDEAQKLVEKAPRVKSNEILEFFYMGYGALKNAQLPLYKLCVLSATPSVTQIEAVPKLLNLLITREDARLPIVKEQIQAMFPEGNWNENVKQYWYTLTRGLVVCYDGHADKSLFAQKHVNPMILTQGNELQRKELVECKGQNKSKCQRAVLDYAKVSKPGFKLPDRINPVAKGFSMNQAQKDLLEPQPKLQAKK